MSTTWYRGEAVGVAPARPGGWLHDFGDGVYFTDDLDVAKKYAAIRAADPVDQRVYSVKVDLNTIKVLDLRTDARWLEFTKAKGPIPSLQQVIKQAGNENYSKYFDAFVKTHKIDLRQYDAVIGPEYVRGGTQMAVLHKNGQTAPLATQLRTKFQPVSVGRSLVPSSKVPTGKLQFHGKIGPGMKVAGGALIGIAISLLLNWLLSKLMDKLTKEHLEQEMSRLRPQIDRDVSVNKLHALDLVADGKEAFVVVRITALTITSFTIDGPIDSVPGLEYEGMFLSEKEINKDEGEKSTTNIGARFVRQTFLMSFDVKFSQEEVEFYTAMKKELQWYDAQVEKNLDQKDIVRLSAERNALMKKLNDALAD